MVKLNWERTELQIQQILDKYKGFTFENKELYPHPIHSKRKNKKKLMKASKRGSQENLTKKSGKIC
ncbi:MAG: hypothetical protein R6U96_18415 [Promethearchaeia archaeon]